MFESLRVITLYTLAVLTPVLIPATVHAVHAVRGWRRTFPARPGLPLPAARGLAPSRCARHHLTSRRYGRSLLLQNRSALPMRGEQREFDVEPVAADFPAAPGSSRPTRYFTELKCRLSSSAANL